MNSFSLSYWLCELALRGFVLVAITLLLRLLLRRSAAEWRYRCGALAILCLLLLPLSFCLPTFWRVTVPVPRGKTAPKEVVTPATTMAALNDSLKQRERLQEATVAPPPIAAPLRFRTIAVGILLFCSLVAALRLLRSSLQMGEALRKCYPVGNLGMHEVLAQVSAEVGIEQPVNLRIADTPGRIPVPMTLGWRHPVILLPFESVDWSPERLQIVLRHELAHIRRGDWLVLFLAEIVRVIYAINPLVSKLIQDLRMEAELATDALVLRSGIRPSDYAEHLLTIAANIRPTQKTYGPLTIAMASDSSLSVRIQTLLQERSAMRTPSFLVALVTALLLTATVSLVTVRVAAEEQKEKSIDTPAQPATLVQTEKDLLVSQARQRVLSAQLTQLQTLLEMEQQRKDYYIRKQIELQRKSDGIFEELNILRQRVAALKSSQERGKASKLQALEAQLQALKQEGSNLSVAQEFGKVQLIRTARELQELSLRYENEKKQP